MSDKQAKQLTNEEIMIEMYNKFIRIVETMDIRLNQLKEHLDQLTVEVRGEVALLTSEDQQPEIFKPDNAIKISNFDLAITEHRMKKNGGKVQ